MTQENTQNTPEGQVQEKPQSLADALASGYEEMEKAARESGDESLEDALDARRDEDEDDIDAVEREASEEESEEKSESEYNEPAPERWPDEMKEAYAKLPPEAKRMMVEQVFKPMQRQYTKTTMELANQRKSIQPMLEALEQHNEVFKEQGADPAEVFRNTLAWASHLTKVGPEKGLADLRASYGLTDSQGNEKQERYLTPVERDLKEKLDRLEAAQQQTNQQRQTEQQRLHQQQQEQAFIQARERIMHDINEFRTEKRDGKPAYPHADELEPQIRGVIEGGLVKRVDEYGQPVPFARQLRDAYDLALNLNPKFRKATSDEGQVQRAKAASDIGVRTRPSSRSGEISELPLSDDLSRMYDRMSGNRR